MVESFDFDSDALRGCHGWRVSGDLNLFVCQYRRHSMLFQRLIFLLHGLLLLCFLVGLLFGAPIQFFRLWFLLQLITVLQTVVEFLRGVQGGSLVCLDWPFSIC